MTDDHSRQVGLLLAYLDRLATLNAAGYHVAREINATLAKLHDLLDVAR